MRASSRGRKSTGSGACKRVDHDGRAGSGVGRGGLATVPEITGGC